MKLTKSEREFFAKSFERIKAISDNSEIFNIVRALDWAVFYSTIEEHAGEEDEEDKKIKKN